MITLIVHRRLLRSLPADSGSPIRPDGKRGTPSATTQKIIDHLLRLADPDRRRDDQEVETTMLVMMRVQRRAIRQVMKEKP